MCFSGVPYIAMWAVPCHTKKRWNCSARYPCITVKDKKANWELSTYPIIYDGITKAINNYEKKSAYTEQEMHSCKLILTDAYRFKAPKKFPWKGNFNRNSAELTTHDILTALSLFWKVHDYIIIKTPK